ncbi:helix-turn-helix domain-containing protein, partial [Bacteroides acidifaciens]|uniref:helix-turn-helix domain-containing protein n=1 Tax=Bacteroides acidifaciens TaxID=85831 RepID=UPI0030133B03
EANEALHLSEKERIVITNCLDIIHMELERPIDRHTQEIVTTNIELLLDYCLRFYERQFITRKPLNTSAIARFETLIDEYLDAGQAATEGLPSVKYFADKICLSPNYFGDLIKKETGKTAKEYIQLKMIEAAKEQLLHPDKTVSEVAYRLGFQYPQHFVRFFKKYEGLTPGQYKQQRN